MKFDDDFITPPASYAHEIMHAFGACDLYYANGSIPQAYVDHCRASGSNDIMFTVTADKTITNEFTELDAYYVGLTGRPEGADAWGLAESHHGSRYPVSGESIRKKHPKSVGLGVLF